MSSFLFLGLKTALFDAVSYYLPVHSLLSSLIEYAFWLFIHLHNPYACLVYVTSKCIDLEVVDASKRLRNKVVSLGCLHHSSFWGFGIFQGIFVLGAHPLLLLFRGLLISLASRSSSFSHIVVVSYDRNIAFSFMTGVLYVNAFSAGLLITHTLHSL